MIPNLTTVVWVALDIYIHRYFRELLFSFFVINTLYDEFIVNERTYIKEDQPSNNLMPNKIEKSIQKCKLEVLQLTMRCASVHQLDSM